MVLALFAKINVLHPTVTDDSKIASLFSGKLGCQDKEKVELISKNEFIEVHELADRILMLNRNENLRNDPGGNKIMNRWNIAPSQCATAEKLG